MATIYEIVDRSATPYGMSLDDFTLRETAPVASEYVLERTGIAPFLIDSQSRQLIFAELPADFDLTKPAFVAPAQASAAGRLLGVPFSELSELAAATPQPARHIFIPCTSRSGTTLLHRIFNRAEGFASFAELSIFAGVRTLDEAGEMGREELAALVSDCVRLQVWPYAEKTVVFKLRAYETPWIRLLNEAVPESGNLMIYRNAIDWTASWWRLHLEWGRGAEFTIEETGTTFGISSPTLEWLSEWLESSARATAPAVVANVMMWVDSMVAYQEAWEHGLRPFTLRYEDLNAHPMAMIRMLFDHFEIARDQIDSAIRAFAHDSQKGTVMARKDERPNGVTLDHDQIDLIHEVLAAHPGGLSASMVLPGTRLP